MKPTVQHVAAPYMEACGAVHAGPAVSAFQKKIRGTTTVLRDHICKQMNELNLERCRCIPKEVPGADWRCLEQLVAQDPAREMYKVNFVHTVLCSCSMYSRMLVELLNLT